MKDLDADSESAGNFSARERYHEYVAFHMGFS